MECAHCGPCCNSIEYLLASPAGCNPSRRGVTLAGEANKKTDFAFIAALPASRIYNSHWGHWLNTTLCPMGIRDAQPIGELPSAS